MGNFPSLQNCKVLKLVPEILDFHIVMLYSRRMAQNIYDFLASEEIEKAQAARFDKIYEECLSDEARLKVDARINQFKTLRYMGDIGAKYLYMALHDFLNMTEQEQRGAKMHGIQLVSIQPLKGESR